MNVSSRTPEGEPDRCPVCWTKVCIDPSLPAGDAPCPNCGHLLWLSHCSIRVVRCVDTYTYADEFDESMIVQWLRLGNERSPATLLLDLGSIAFLSSDLVAWLVALKKESDGSARKLALFNVSPNVHEMLKMEGLKGAFEIFAGETEAIDSFG